MKCPFCESEELKVTDSRNSVETNSIRRRRECLKCQKRFTTFETVEISLQVHKRDGRYEDFSQTKLINGLESACHHTSVSRDQILQLASEITTELIQDHSRAISSSDLGHIVMRELELLDSIAYIRFACVYQRLKNIDELMVAIEKVKSKDDTNKENYNGLKEGSNQKV